MACLDDYSRHVVARLYAADDRPALADLLKRAITLRGKPEAVYADNGGPYHSDMLATACARLGIAPRHTRPYRPQGRGKVERFFLTAQRQWGREAQALIDAGRLQGLEDCQRFFVAWLRSDYNARVHSSTREAPETRLAAIHPEHPLIWVDPQMLADAFLWTETRVVTAVGTVSIEGHDFEVAPELARRKVTLRFDPYDLSRILVEHDGRSFGLAHALGALPAHSRRVRAPEAPDTPAAERTPFHELLQNHNEQQRARQVGRMSFIPSQAPATDLPAEGEQQP